MPEWWEQDKAADPNEWWSGDSPIKAESTTAVIEDPNEAYKKGVEVQDMAVDLEMPLETIETNYDNLTEKPKKIIPGTILPSGVGEPSELKAAPERTKWQKFKKFFVGERPPLPPNADRIEKLTRAFDIGVSLPLRTFLKFGKGMTFNAPDLMWAAIKRITPEDMWVDEVRNMTLDEAMDWAGGYNPSGFQKSVGEIAEFIGRIKTVAPIAQKLGIIGGTPKDISVLIKAFETAKLFGAAAVVEQVTKGASDIIEPTEAEYGFEGPKAVLRDMALGAIFSLVSQGVKGLWSKLTPSEFTRALKLLGLKKGATQEEITKAANSLARQYHPDKVKGLVDDFKQVIKARDLLRQGEAKEIVYRGQKLVLKPKLLPGEAAPTEAITAPSKPVAVQKAEIPTISPAKAKGKKALQITPEETVGMSHNEFQNWGRPRSRTGDVKGLLEVAKAYQLRGELDEYQASLLTGKLEDGFLNEDIESLTESFGDEYSESEIKELAKRNSEKNKAIKEAVKEIDKLAQPVAKAEAKSLIRPERRMLGMNLSKEQAEKLAQQTGGVAEGYGKKWQVWKEKPTKAEPAKVEPVPLRKPVTVSGKEYHPQTIPVESIGVDPKRFQFKLGAKLAGGVTEALKAVEKYDPVKAGEVLVWQDKGGKYWVIDGHHRVALARKTGQETMDAWVVREEDGWTEAAARATGALRNLADGKGTAVDAAKLFRDSNITLEQLRKEGVPTNNVIVQQGMEMKGLSDEVFRLVVDERLPANMAAAIGRGVKGPTQQKQVADLILEGEIETVRQAEFLAMTIDTAPVLTKQEQTLFGVETTEKSLYAERAKILANVEKKLKTNRKVFGTLAKQSGLIESKGNILDRIANMETKEMAEEVLYMLDKFANAKGEVAEALNEATKEYAKYPTKDNLTKITNDLVQRWTEATTGLTLQNIKGLFGVPAKGAGAEIEPAKPKFQVNAEIVHNWINYSNLYKSQGQSPTKAMIETLPDDVQEAIKQANIRHNQQGISAKEEAKRLAAEYPEYLEAPAEKVVAPKAETLAEFINRRTTEYLSPLREQKKSIEAQLEELETAGRRMDTIVRYPHKSQEGLAKQWKENQKEIQKAGVQEFTHNLMDEYKVEPAKVQNFTQFATEHGYPSDYDITDHSMLSPSGKVSKRSKDQAMKQLEERIRLNKQAHQEYNEAILAGEIIDPTEGFQKVTKEGLLARQEERIAKEVEGRLAQITTQIRFLKDTGKGKRGIKPSYQKQIDELEAELSRITKGKAGKLDVTPLQDAFTAFMNIIEPSKAVEIKLGKEVYATVIKGVHKADVARIEFNEEQIENMDRNLREFGEALAKYPNKVLKDLMLARGKPHSPGAIELRDQALKDLAKEAPELVGTRKTITNIADFNYKYLTDVVGDDIHYVEDYFYGIYKDPKKVERFIQYWKTTKRFTKEKKLPTVADAVDYGLALRDYNPVNNLMAEYMAIARLDGMIEMRDELMRTGEDKYISKDSEKIANSEKIPDPVFKGLWVDADLARMIKNLISTNKVMRIPALNNLRKVNNFLREVKFMGSMFHQLAIIKHTMADSGYLGFLYKPTAYRWITTGFKKGDPMFQEDWYKKYIGLGGGHRYSIASEAQRGFTQQIQSLTKSSQLAIRIGTAPLAIPENYVRWLFERYIPKIKALKYRDAIFERQKKLGRELTDAEHIEIIKEGQNIYGMMNERTFGRSGTVTTLMRFKFIAPGFAEGNFRQELKAYVQWGQKDTFRAGRSRADILNSFLLTAIGATIGTLILTGKPPKKPETVADIRDLFKIDTGKVDAKSRKLMIDLMTYDRDFWILFGKPFIGQAGDVPGDLFRRLGGMTSTTWDVMSDLNQLSMGKAIYDWKGERVVEVTDPFAKRVLDLVVFETLKTEPISLNVFGQARERELDRLTSSIVMLLGMRPTTSEKDKRESEIISRIFSLRDRQERLYYYLGSIKEPRKHIDKYNKIAQGILDNPVTTNEMREKWGKNLIIDTERLVSNKVHTYELAKVTEKPEPEEIKKLKKWLDNFDISESQYRSHLITYEFKHRKLILEMRKDDADELLKTEIAKFYADKGILARKVTAGTATDTEKRESRKYEKISSNISQVGTLIHKTEAWDKRKRYYERIRSMIERSND